MTKNKVLEVTEVRLNLLESLPVQLVILATGTVPTGGWKNPELVPYVYIQPPPDGIYDFDFVAEPPDEPAIQVITPIIAKHRFGPINDDMKGVRIHASSNSEVALLNQVHGGRTVCIKGTLTDEGVECQAMRTEDNELYTLVGELNGFQVGNKVYVSGVIAEASFCQQGTTLSINWIGTAVPMCK